MMTLKRFQVENKRIKTFCLYQSEFLPSQLEL